MTITQEAPLYTPERDNPLEAPDNFQEMMERYIHDPDIHELITAMAEFRGIEVADLSNPELDEDTFMREAQRTLDFRNGRPRFAIENIDKKLPPRVRNALDTVKRKNEMDIDSEPTRSEVDAAFVLGSSGDTPGYRLGYLLELMKAGKVDTDLIVMIGSERPVTKGPHEPDEINIAGEAGKDRSGNSAETEFDIMRNSAAVALDIADEEWQAISGYDPNIPEQHHYQYKYRIAYAEKDGKHIIVLSAPMLSEERLNPNGTRRIRSNTADGFRMAAEMMRDFAEPDQELKTLTVTDAIYRPFQGPDANSLLARLGIENETVGKARTWPQGEALYAQEILSMLRQTRAARDYALVT